MVNLRKGANTDGILIKVQSEDDIKIVEQIIHEWEKRTRFKMEIDRYTKVFQKDVNNYIIVPDGELYDLKGKPRWKSKGAWVKKQSVLDYELPIVNKAIINYFIFGKSVKDTILSADKLIEFQMISKIGQTYEYCVKEDLTKPKLFDMIVSKSALQVFPSCERDIKSINGEIYHNRVYRLFASKDLKDGHFYKKHKTKNSLDLVPNSPERCRILNTDITELGIPNWLDLQFYIDLANKRISEFC